MDDTNKTCREFVAALASSAPTPGGGGAAALCGAVGAALCGMVASLTTGKKKYVDVEREIQQLLESTNALQNKLLDQVRADGGLSASQPRLRHSQGGSHPCGGAAKRC